MGHSSWAVLRWYWGLQCLGWLGARGYGVFAVGYDADMQLWGVQQWARTAMGGTSTSSSCNLYLAVQLQLCCVSRLPVKHQEQLHLQQEPCVAVAYSADW